MRVKEPINLPTELPLPLPVSLNILLLCQRCTLLLDYRFSSLHCNVTSSVTCDTCGFSVLEFSIGKYVAWNQIDTGQGASSIVTARDFITARATAAKAARRSRSSIRIDRPSLVIDASGHAAFAPDSIKYFCTTAVVQHEPYLDNLFTDVRATPWLAGSLSLSPSREGFVFHFRQPLIRHGVLYLYALKK